MTSKPRGGLLTGVLGVFKGKYAWLANTVTGAALILAGDTIEQKIEMMRNSPHPHHPKYFDWERFKRMGMIGAFEGPPHHFFYTWLEMAFPGRTKGAIAKKIISDQVLGSPFFNIQFFVGMSLLEGKNWRDSWKEFVTKFPTVFVADCIFWPPLQLINFYLIPRRFCVLYINVVTVFWNIFLSYMKHYDFYKTPGENGGTNATTPGAVSK